MDKTEFIKKLRLGFNQSLADSRKSEELLKKKKEEEDRLRREKEDEEMEKRKY